MSDDVYQDGYDEGYNSGQEDGYNAGFEEGLEEGREQGRDAVMDGLMDYLDYSDIDGLNSEYASDRSEGWINDSVIGNLRYVDTNSLKRLAAELLEELEGRI